MLLFARYSLSMLLMASIPMMSFAWDGSGTETDPYMIRETQDWYDLNFQVSRGNTFAGSVFRLATDINTNGVMVGTEEYPFGGTFDGDGHTLTFSRGTAESPSEKRTAPFQYVSGATIRHLNTTGTIFCSQQYTSGLVSMVLGDKPTTLYNCQSNIEFQSHEVANAAFGGLVGAVNTGGLTMEKCVFDGFFNSENSAGMVGWSNVDVSITNSMVDPKPGIFVNGGATFARMAGGAKLTLTDCYFTDAVEVDGINPQGEGVFNQISLPSGGSYEFVSDPEVFFGGKRYWRSGAIVHLTAPEGVPFDHWFTGIANSCYVSDPWNPDGDHQLCDITGQPVITISTDMPKAWTEHTFYGVKYRYLSRDDYRLYVSWETCKAKQWTLDADGWLVTYDQDGDKLYITAVTGTDGNINRTMDGAWMWNTAFTGTIIQNDNFTGINDRTHLGIIAPRAFKGCTELRRLAFQSDDGNWFFKAIHEPSFIIGEEAFADCPNLKEFDLMYYNRTGTDKWDPIPPSSVFSVADNAFRGSTNCRILVDPTVYQDYMGDPAWRTQRPLIGLYMPVEEDMSVNGARYSYVRNREGKAVKNDVEGHESLMATLSYWNADYQNFTASGLLAELNKGNIWYAQVVGADADYLKKNDGVMRIYNDPGSYWNYKTIAIGNGAFQNCEELKVVEFWQTNGRSENSYTDPKLVIQNGAFKGCKNLRELRMFYYVQDGDDHWEALGPEDVIPGDNIFGSLSVSERMALSEEERAALGEAVPEGFKILVSPGRMQEFLSDPNWLRYGPYLEAVDFDPIGRSEDFTMGDQKGITYGYMSNYGGLHQTSQTVSQDVSWWTAPRIAIEVLIDLATIGTFNSTEAAIAIAPDVLTNAELVTVKQVLANSSYEIVSTNELIRMFSATVIPKKLEELGLASYIQDLSDAGLISYFGNWTVSEYSPDIILNQVSSRISRETFVEILSKVVQQADAQILRKTSQLLSIQSQNRMIRLLNVAKLMSVSSANTTSSYLSAKQWGGSGAYNGDMLRKGMRENLLSNIHQVGLVGGGYVITTPVKNIAYHTYIKNVADDVTHAVIYVGTDKGQGNNANTVTTTMGKTAFRGKKKLERVSFYESNVTTNEAVPMLFTIPDSAFVGCDSLKELSLLLETDGHGTRALGPESFILGGDSIFAGLSPKTFHIVIDPSRRQDFLDNKSWAPLERFFVYEKAKPKAEEYEYGADYAFAYENGSVQRVTKALGHKIEHTVVIGPTTKSGEYHLAEHQGALKLCNDIGSYNNYQLDAVMAGAFKGNRDLRVINFTDLLGTGAFGDCYTGLDVVLEDSCFAHCPNLANMDLIYLVTDGTNHIDPITPKQLKIGRGVFDGTRARIKMMPQQVAWFEADSAWNAYRHRFMPCIISPGDEAVRTALKDMVYYDMAATGYDPSYWTEYIDLARIGGVGFSWLDGRFDEQKDKLQSFADFEYFASVGLDYVGTYWFNGCTKLTNIRLPQTIRRIEASAFEGCTSLAEIELPDSVQFIGGRAFFNCPQLLTIVVRGAQPAELQDRPFPFNDNMRIYVPSASVDAYRTAWPQYAQYIADNGTYRSPKVVTVSEAGTLANKMGITLGKERGKLTSLSGPYSKYDSLTVIGPINGEDIALLRFLCGADFYGRHTDGRLRYLNLWDARTCEDRINAYVRGGTSVYIKHDDYVPDYMFEDCRMLQSVILPKSASHIGENIFEDATALQRVCVGSSTTSYESDIFQNLSGVQELVLLTSQPMMSDSSDPWEADIDIAFTYKSKLGDYLGDPRLTERAHSVVALFADDAVMSTLADRGEFFPSSYLYRQSVEGLFSGSESIEDFDDFESFHDVREINLAFADMPSLRCISLPDSLRLIGSDAFRGCSSLRTIRLSCDSVPQLGDEAFRDLAPDFSILVPKQLCKLYRQHWPQYADHINPDLQHRADDEILVVTTTEKNTLASQLGLEVAYDKHIRYSNNQYNNNKITFLCNVRGDYSHIRRLKVVGPISGGDLALLRYLSGFCCWANTRNYSATLEYLDLYDADLQASEYEAASDMFWAPSSVGPSYVKNDGVLPSYAFLQCYNLHTLILPRTLKKIETRALQQCEALEVLVVGEETSDINWSAFDDDAMLTRLYLLSKQKPELDMDNWLWRNLCNNYHPTFDAFYVRPSIYEDYLFDDAYTGSTWQRTNNISTGEFKSDHEFLAFASHAAATSDDLLSVESVDGWFNRYTDIRDLTPLRLSSIDSLSRATMSSLTHLEKIALPGTMEALGDSAFVDNCELRYVDMLMCDTTAFIDTVRVYGLKLYGIDTQRTLAYLPASYGPSDTTNVVVSDGTRLHAQAFRLIDDRDYYVPYGFETDRVENTRILTVSAVPYTICVPYAMKVPQYARAYRLSDREGSTLTFTEVEKGSTLEALQPYLIKAVGYKRLHKTTVSLNTDLAQTIPASGGMTYGRQVDAPGYSLRGTLDAIDNATASAMGTYILQSDGNWHPVATSTEAERRASVLPYRAFLLPSARHASDRIGMTLVDSDTSGIDTVETIDLDGTRRYYDLQGRELEFKPEHGIYIVNGEKRLR